MRLRVILIMLLAASLAQATTIRLKNGRRILCDSAQERDGRIEYQIGDNTYSIPKDLVAGVEALGSPIPSSDTAGTGSGSGTHEKLPEIVPTETIKGWDELRGRLVREGHIDAEALASLDNSNNPELAAAAYFVAASHEAEVGNPEKARLYLDRALVFEPDNAVILTRYAALLVGMERYTDAISYAERASRLAPNSADTFAVLGEAYFQTDRTDQAIRAWQHSLALRPSATVEALLAKAQRESAVQSAYSEQETSHFVLRYEGKETSPELRRAILDTLESHYTSLVGDLGVAPRDPIPVILYTEQAYFNVTQAPGWTGALYDGKLRIPIQGIDSITPEFSGVLKHELTHSFIAQETHGRCPTWLNEGIAMLEEGQSPAAYGSQLGRLYRTHKNIPLNQLEGSFMAFNDVQATVAYVESLASVAYIRDTYGMSDLQRILVRIGEGSSTESALRATIHSGYAQLEDEVGQYLEKTYGD